MKKVPIWKNVILLVSVLVVIIIATFAWFFTRPMTSVDKMTVHVGKATYLQISGDNGNNWSDDLNVEFGVNRNFKEISGDGSTFYAPVYENIADKSGGFSTQIVSFEQVDQGEKYYEEVFEFRSDTAQNIYLAPESYVASVDEQGNSYIDGAIRVAFFELDDQGAEILKCIWAPNSMVEYSAATNSFTRDGNVESYYYYQKTIYPVDPDLLGTGVNNTNIATISTANTDAFGCGYNATHKFMWTNGENMPSNAPALLTMENADEDNLYHKKMKIKVWIEGYDRECVSLLSGQRFNMMLQFAAQKGE